MPLRTKFENSPVAARVVPFAVFIFLTFAQNECGETARYWIYFLKSVLGAWLIWETWPFVKEMRANISWEAVAVGVGVCVMWIGLDGLYPGMTELSQKLGMSKPPAYPVQPWNPHAQFGQNSEWAWFFIGVRILGSALVVPFLEEVVFRSFLYRYIAKPDFESVPLGQFLPLPFFATALVFALEHEQWLAGILCGFAYQWLVLRKKRLGDAIVAHGITNLLLGLWVVWKGDWKFW